MAGFLEPRGRSLGELGLLAGSYPRPCRFRAHRRRWRATVTLNPSVPLPPPLRAPLPPPRPAPFQVSGENNANAKRRAWGTASAAALRPGERRRGALNTGAGGRRRQSCGDRAAQGVEAAGGGEARAGVCVGVAGAAGLEAGRCRRGASPAKWSSRRPGELSGTRSLSGRRAAAREPCG